MLVPLRYFCVGGQWQGLPDGEVARVDWCRVFLFFFSAPRYDVGQSAEQGTFLI